MTTGENTGHDVSHLQLEPPRRPPKGHRGRRYRQTRKLDHSRVAVELRRSIWPGFHAVLASVREDQR
jgi:hypothetical protein